MNGPPKHLFPPVQLHAGYVLQPVYEELARLVSPPEATGVDKLRGLYTHLSAFELYADFERQVVEIKPEWAVLSNLISRGLPALASVAVEDAFAEVFGCSERRETGGEIRYGSLLHSEEVKRLFSVLHVVDPRWQPDYDEDRLESSFEKDFIHLLAGSEQAYLVQLLDAQRELTTITPVHSELLAKQRVDFVVEEPYDYITTLGETGHVRRGTVVEIDGEAYHSSEAQRAHDELRQRAVAAMGWTTLRVRGLPESKQIIDALSSGDYMAHIKWCWRQDMKEESHARALQIALSPFAIARIQKSVVEAVLAGKLDLAEKRWSVFVYERDVPCAALAFRDLASWYNHLMELQGRGERFPEVDLDIVSTREFSDSPLHLGMKVCSNSLKKQYDLVLDVSMLRRAGIENPIQLPAELPAAKATLVIRSSHYQRSSRKIYTSAPIVYQPLVTKTAGRYRDIEPTRHTLQFFLRNLFRKKAFREGQLPIIDRALRGESVIGLLPTGGGKSLTYQLAAMLQPGVTLVVDPLRSLMKDQYDGLLRMRIDACAYINSDIEVGRRNRIQQQMLDSELQLVFISPERLTVPDFRNVLDEMFRCGVFFAYGVIDEVHCVSEWGHDFRTSYLHLGMNLRRFARCKDERALPLFGLTATASFDVLADVERELAGTGALLGADAIVRFENTNRLELQYKIEKVTGALRKKPVANVKNRKGEDVFVERVDVGDLWDVRKTVGYLKTEQLNPFVHNIPRLIDELQTPDSLERIVRRFDGRLGTEGEKTEKGAAEALRVEQEELFLKRLPGREEYRYAGILFCPHKEGALGVKEVKSNVEAIADDVGIFMGGEDNLLAKECLENQQMFKENKLSVMVATKAFGMGIDKPNVRYTVNINYPSSLESFVQEAGRAGRDRRMALAGILYSDIHLIRINELNKPADWQKSDDRWGWQALEKIKYAWFTLQDFEELLQELELADFVHGNEGIKLEAYDPDYEVPLFFFNQSFPGEEKEKTIFNELLEKIDVPVGKYQEKEAVRLFEDSIFASLDAHEEGDRYIFPVSMSNSLAAPAEMIKKIARVLDMQLSEVQMEYLKLAVGDIHKCTAAGVMDCLLRQPDLLYSALPPKPFCVLKENGKYVLPNPFADYHTRERVKGCRKEIEALFHRLRDKPVTDKAIYRMVCIGLIDDFTVDYNNDLYRLGLVRKAPGSYFRALEDFYGRYYSREAARQRVRDLRAADIKEEIRICLEELTHFIYDKTMKKRRRAMDDMRAFCMNGVVPGRDWKESNEDLKDYLYYYFNSKYARQGNETEDGEPYSLLDDTDNGKVSAFWIVEKYMKMTDDKTDVSGTPVDNVKHLQGAVRLIRRSLVKDNPALQLLNAFCLFFLGTEENEALKKERNDDFYDGFIAIYEESKETVGREEFLRCLEAYCTQVSGEGNVAEREEVRAYLREAGEQILFLVHCDCVKDITDKYIS